ncbi:MAG: carbohydrate ABC transporter permease [Streptosporangiales bacterium]
MRTTRTETYLSYTMLTLMAIVVMVPFVTIVFTAFQPSNSPVSGLALPSTWSWGNFAEAWTTAGFGRLIGNGLLIAVGVVPLSVALATLAGYALGTMRLPGAGVVFTLFLLGLTLPIELIVIPLYFDLRAVGLTNSYWGVILAESAVFMPFGVFWMRAHFLSTPRSLLEAAEIDGATTLRTLWSVLMPLARAPMSTLAVLYFMWSWNQFLLVLVLIQNPAKRTATAGLGFFVGQYSTNVPLLAAGTIIVLLPICIMYLAFQRQFIRGMMQGAFKG